MRILPTATPCCLFLFVFAVYYTVSNIFTLEFSPPHYFQENMAPNIHFHHLILLLLLTTTTTSTTTVPPPTTSPSPQSTPKPPSSSSSPPLDPKQIIALQSLNIPITKDPCSPLHNSTTICDTSKPFRHIISLTLSNCTDDVALSLTALKSLSTLTSLSFINCPISPIKFPSELTSNLHSFTCINSLKKLTGIWLSRLTNVAELTVSQVSITASGPAIILGNIKHLHSVTISHTNLTGFLPKHWHPNLTHVDLSNNQLKGKVPSSINVMENLLVLNLSSNSLTGEIPTTIGDLTSLQNISLSSNSISGSIPDTLAAMPGLIHLDLGSNQLNGTVPKFIQDMKHLKLLNIEKNNFHGVLPFNASFISRLEVFKIGGNDNLCYNHSSLLSLKMKLGIAPCDKHGLPMSPPPAKEASSSGDSDDDGSEDDDNAGGQNQEHHHGPNKVVLGVSIALASIVFLIVFMLLLNKCCK